MKLTQLKTSRYLGRLAKNVAARCVRQIYRSTLAVIRESALVSLLRIDVMVLV